MNAILFPHLFKHTPSPTLLIQLDIQIFRLSQTIKVNSRILNENSTFSLLSRKTMQHLRYMCSTNKNTINAIFLQLTHCILFISSKGNLGRWRGFEKCGSEWPRIRNRWQAQYSSFDLFNISMDNLTSGINERVTWKLSFSFLSFFFFHINLTGSLLPKPPLCSHCPSSAATL